MTEGNLSASDVAMLTDRGCDWGGNSFMWIFALLILAGGGFGGWNGNRGFGEPIARQSDVQNGFNFAALERQNNEIVDAVRQGVYDTTGAVKDASYNNLGELREIQQQISNGFANMQNCCSAIERGIDGVNYNAALNTAAINANTTAQTQKILDAIATNKMAEMQNQINALQLQNAVAGVVRYPTTSAYCAGNNPYCGCPAGI